MRVLVGPRIWWCGFLIRPPLLSAEVSLSSRRVPSLSVPASVILSLQDSTIASQQEPYRGACACYLLCVSVGLVDVLLAQHRFLSYLDYHRPDHTVRRRALGAQSHAKISPGLGYFHGRRVPRAAFSEGATSKVEQSHTKRLDLRATANRRTSFGFSRVPVVV